MNQLIPAIFLIFLPFLSIGQKIDKKHSPETTVTEWLPAELMHSEKRNITISGNPELIDCKYGKALHFNGSTDGVFLKQMPFSGLKQFTIEVLFYPESGGNFEQRLLHLGEIRGNRVLFETRSNTTDWYFDAFIFSGDQKKTLIDSTLLHPFNQWYHLAYVVNRGKLTTFINGEKELESQIKFTPLRSGKTSIGVRQDQRSWFKGAIYKIRITPEALNPSEFMTFR